MNRLRDIIGFAMRAHPNRRAVSLARLAKTIFLADWCSAQIQKKTISDIDWTQENFTPIIDEIIMSIQHDPAFMLKVSPSADGPGMESLRVSPLGRWPSLSAEDKAILRGVVAVTKSKPWLDFLDVVDSTYPIATDMYATKKLEAIAREAPRLDAITIEVSRGIKQKYLASPAA